MASRRVPSILLASALLAASAFAFQQHAWKVGERVEIWSRRMGSASASSYSWRKATITEVFGWGGAHAKCDDDPNYIENLGVYDPESAANARSARSVPWARTPCRRNG